MLFYPRDRTIDFEPDRQFDTAMRTLVLARADAHAQGIAPSDPNYPKLSDFLQATLP